MADNHGSTPAAWVAVFIALLAFVVGGVALVFSPPNWVMFWIGAALLPVAMIVGKVMSAMGLGADHERRADEPRADEPRAREPQAHEPQA